MSGDVDGTSSYLGAFCGEAYGDVKGERVPPFTAALPAGQSWTLGTGDADAMAGARGGVD